ncbi:MAG: hypothetical protein ABW023_07530 [Sphingomonas sp.]
MEFAVQGAPIVTAACHCASCRKAAAGFAALPGAPQVLNAEGGVDFTLYRKDRIAFREGYDLLRGYRLAPTSPTRRVLAGCCDTPMFLEFQKGHWLSIYRDRFGDAAPVVDLRVMTGDREDGGAFEDDIPSYRKHSGKFMWRLLSAWAAMGFRAPTLAPIEAAR